MGWGLSQLADLRFRVGWKGEGVGGQLADLRFKVGWGGGWDGWGGWVASWQACT